MKYSAGLYDAGKCTAACNATTSYDSRHPRPDGSYDACVCPPLSLFRFRSNRLTSTELRQRILHPHRRRPGRYLLLYVLPALDPRLRHQLGTNPRHEEVFGG